MLKLGSSSLYKIYSLVWRKDMIFFTYFGINWLYIKALKLFIMTTARCFSDNPIWAPVLIYYNTKIAKKKATWRNMPWRFETDRLRKLRDNCLCCFVVIIHLDFFLRLKKGKSLFASWNLISFVSGEERFTFEKRSSWKSQGHPTIVFWKISVRRNKY